MNKLTSTSPPSFSINVPLPTGPGCPSVPPSASLAGRVHVDWVQSQDATLARSLSNVQAHSSNIFRQRGGGAGKEAGKVDSVAEERDVRKVFERKLDRSTSVWRPTQPAPSRPSEHNLPTCPKILSKHPVLLLATFWKTCVSQKKKKRARFPRGLQCLRARASPASVPPRPSWQTEASDYDSHLEWRGEATERHNGISAQNPLHSIQWAAHNTIIAPAATISTHNYQNVWNALSSIASASLCISPNFTFCLFVLQMCQFCSDPLGTNCRSAFQMLVSKPIEDCTVTLNTGNKGH